MKRKPTRKPLRKMSLRPLPRLKAEAWKWMSIVVRMSHTKRGKIYCYTCEKELTFKSAQAGHYIHNKLDYDSRNIHVQCGQCNCFKKGNSRIYGLKLEEEYGFGILQQLERDARVIKKWNRYELEAMIKKLKQEAYDLGFKEVT